MKISYIISILKTNWINLLGVFLAVFVYGIVTNILNPNPTVLQSFWQSIFAVLFGICYYGILFWVLYIVTLVAFDLLFIVKNQNNLKKKMLIEWFLTSLPFIYWMFEYEEWIFLVGIIVFLITQLIRKNLIAKVIH